MARKNLEDYKKESPEIPSITCPYIDFIQEILKEVKENNIDNLFKKILKN